MKRRGLPIWLLRDVPALLGVMISFWPLMILVITNGFRAMRGGKVRQTAYIDFAILLAHAEARLAFALWREAYRRIGWNPHSVQFNLVPASDAWDETTTRFHTYMRAMRDMNSFVDAYVEDLRERYSISERDARNSSCPLPPSLRFGAPCRLVAKRGRSNGVLFLHRRSRGRWRATQSRDGGGSHSSRGPPFAIRNSLFAQPTSAPPRLRSSRHASARELELRSRIYPAVPRGDLACSSSMSYCSSSPRSWQLA